MSATAPQMPDDAPSFHSSSAKPGPPGGRLLKICIASAEFIGAEGEGKTGFGYTAMARTLATAGHEVTCLFLGAKEPGPGAWQESVEKFRRDGLTLVRLPQINASELVAPSNLIRSYETYHWLKK